MWPFKKSYYIMWSFGSDHAEYFAEVIKGYDAAHAWKTLRSQHELPIHCIRLELVDNDVKVSI